jgi:hypothetical protein
LSTRAPSAEDDVVFDSTSNATGYTVTISNNASVCRDLTISGPASGNVTVAGNGNLYIYGSLSLSAAGITRTFTGETFYYGSGSRTITTNGVTLGSNIYFNGSGTYTLQDALNIGAGAVSINSGTFDTDGKNLTCGGITATAGATAGILTLGASTVSATSFTPNAPVIVNAGTSNITLSGTTPNIGGGTNYTGNTFYNVTFSSSSPTSGNFRGTNTFNNLTFTTPTNSTLVPITLFGNQTVNGTLTVAGSGAINRYMFLSDPIGTTRTLTVATVGTLTDVDFRDITVAGASSPWSGTRLGNAGGNTNITFGAGATKYWNLAAGGAWTAAAWATTSGGAASVTNFPLAQDTAIIENTGLNTSASITGFSGYNLKTLDCSTRSNAATLSGIEPRINDDVTLSTSMTVSSLSILFEGRTTQTITSAGRTLGAIAVNNSGSTVTLADAYNGNFISVISGTFDTNNQNVTVSGPLVVTANSLSKTITLGSSTVSCTTFGATATGITNFTLNAGTSSITASSTYVGVAGVSSTFYNVTSTSTGAVTLNGTNTFNNLTCTSPTATGVTAITLSGNQTISGTLALAGGTSVTQRRQIVSSVIGITRTITAATVTGLTDIDFRDIQGAGAANWTTGTRLGDCGGNSGITFPAAKTVYWNLAGTQNWSATAWATSSGGSPAANNFPLAQDTAVFDDTGSAGTITINAAWNIGTISSGGRTIAWTLAGTSSPSIYGDITYGSGITSSATGSFTFSGASTQTLTTAGKSLSSTVAVTKPAGVALNLGDALSCSAVNVTSGTLNSQNYNISALSFNSNNSNTRSITLGTSTITLNGSGANTWQLSNTTGLTFSGASSTINLSSAAAKTFAGGGQTFGTLSSTGGTTSPLTISGSNTFTTFTNTARTYLIFTSGTTQTVTNFTYSGASGSVVRWYTSIPGQRATLATTTSAVGANSVDGGNNSGLTFTGSSPDYFYVKDIAYAALAGGAAGKFFLMF